MANAYTTLAKNVLEEYVKNHKLYQVAAEELPSDLTDRQAACFVSLKKDGELRGCIGTLEPVQDTLAQEIMSNAISAGTRDPRFRPVTPDELDDIVYSVDVLTPSRPVEDLSKHDVKKHGIIVTDGHRRGVLLPDLEGVDDTQTQISIAAQKGGFYPGEDFRLEEFEVVRHHEDDDD